MATLVFPVSQDGLIVDALVGIPGKAMAALVSSGKPIPRPTPVRAMIDTGTNITIVSAPIPSQVGVPRGAPRTTQTFTATVSVNIFEISLSLTNLKTPGAAQFVEPNLLVADMPASLDGIDVLIGTDVLGNCRTTIDGPQQRFTPDF